MSIKAGYNEMIDGRKTGLGTICESDLAGPENNNANTEYKGFAPPQIPDGNKHLLVQTYTSKYKINETPITFAKVGTQPSFNCDVYSTEFLGPYYSHKPVELVLGTSKIVVTYSEDKLTIEDHHSDGTLYETHTFTKVDFVRFKIPEVILVCLQAAGGSGGCGKSDGQNSVSGAGGGSGGFGCFFIDIKQFGQITITLGKNGCYQGGDIDAYYDAEDSEIYNNSKSYHIYCYGGGGGKGGQNGGRSAGAYPYRELCGDTVGKCSISTPNGRYYDGSSIHEANSDSKTISQSFKYYLYGTDATINGWFKGGINFVGAAGIDNDFYYGGGGGAPAPFISSIFTNNNVTVNGIDGCNGKEDGRDRDISLVVGAGGGGAFLPDHAIGSWPTPGGRAACKIFIGYSKDK